MPWQVVSIFRLPNSLSETICILRQLFGSIYSHETLAYLNFLYATRERLQSTYSTKALLPSFF